MNTLFWLLAAGLIVLALFIVVLPILRNRNIATTDSRQHNIEIARQRLLELKQLKRQGQILEQDYAEQQVELELNLSNELEAAKQQADLAHQGKWMIPVVLWFVPFLSLVSYFALGDLDALLKLEQQQQVAQKQNIDQNAVEKMVAGLAKKLQETPEDAKGWQMLGRSYKHLKQYDKAAQAYAQAYQILGDQPEIMLLYADALALVNGTLHGQPAKLVNKAVQLEPQNTSALWLAGMAKAEQGQLQAALAHWLKLKSLVSPQSQEHTDLVALIASLQKRIAEQPSAQAGEMAQRQDAVEKPENAIKVAVQLDAAVAGQFSASDTVFIYAQALKGPKMPLAIVKKQVADLPVSVELNDSLAMMPSMTLSSYSQVKVIARISKTGNAMQQAGDAMGFQVVKDKEAVSIVEVQINQFVP